MTLRLCLVLLPHILRRFDPAQPADQERVLGSLGRHLETPICPLGLQMLSCRCELGDGQGQRLLTESPVA